MLKLLKTLGVCTYRAWYSAIVKHDAIEHAGYLSFLGMLALFPFLVLLMTFAGWVGQGALGHDFIAALFNHLPQAAVDAVKPRVEELIAGPPQGLLAVSILGAIWTSSSAVEGMRTVLNRAYHVHTPPAYIFRRTVSILQLLVFTLLIIVGMLLLVFGPIFLGQVEAKLGVHVNVADIANLGNLVLSFSAGMLFLVVASLYYILPNIKQTFVDVVPGAFITVTLWTIAASLFSYYLSQFDQVNIIYGSLGGIIATLLFFYIINVIFIFGAELNYQLVVSLGMKIEEREHVDDHDVDIHATD